MGVVVVELVAIVVVVVLVLVIRELPRLSTHRRGLRSSVEACVASGHSLVTHATGIPRPQACRMKISKARTKRVSNYSERAVAI